MCSRASARHLHYGLLWHNWLPRNTCTCTRRSATFYFSHRIFGQILFAAVCVGGAVSRSRRMQGACVGPRGGDGPVKTVSAPSCPSCRDRLASLTVTLVVSAQPAPWLEQVACPSQQSHSPCTAAVRGGPSRAAFRLPAARLRPTTEEEHREEGMGGRKGSNKCHCKHK